ncbi:MAG: threonine--tRNA ligase, partial [Candidatus Methylomirabilis sp.]|nr:threonine--tRNA ligase [Deltaproteobacteria bacterium]
ETDRSDEKIQKKIREALTAKVPNLLIVGEKEAADGTVTLRRYGEEKQETLAFDAFLAEIGKEIAERTMRRRPGV